ncbi:M20/M25/M40 family metallo-hydrolase, partial [Candidatus Binatus sp.]|uniref:M20/M25/M40 family metallo-hydrolase n=1 Tax=Candidatus Binatus sp. TaxID=2811406 RepID=UPI003C698293
AEAGLDCRLLPGTDADAFMERLRDLLGPGDFKIEYLQRPDDAPPSPTSGEAWDAIKRVVASDFNDARVVPWMTTGGTDSRVLRAKGVPAYGFVPVILGESEVSRIHGDDERLSVENLNRGIKATYDLTMDLCAARH